MWKGQWKTVFWNSLGFLNVPIVFLHLKEKNCLDHIKKRKIISTSLWTKGGKESKLFSCIMVNLRKDLSLYVLSAEQCWIEIRSLFLKGTGTWLHCLFGLCGSLWLRRLWRRESGSPWNTPVLSFLLPSLFSALPGGVHKNMIWAWRMLRTRALGSCCVSRCCPALDASTHRTPPGCFSPRMERGLTPTQWRHVGACSQQDGGQRLTQWQRGNCPFVGWSREAKELEQGAAMVFTAFD